MDLLTIREAARVLRQSEGSVRRKIRLGELPAHRVGELGPLRVERAELLRHLVSADAVSGEST